jgi:septal ring factor EnvC (AmiA/AmiB activator)
MNQDERALFTRLRSIERKQDLILTVLCMVERETSMALKQTDELIQEVADESTLIDGLGVVVDGVAQNIADLKTQITAAKGDPVKIDQAFSAVQANIQKLSSSKDKLAAALAANTDIPPDVAAATS